MLLLALDTSTPAVTVALHDGDRVLAESTTVDPRRHAELLMPQVTHVLREAGADRLDLTDIAVGVGPGPFTGLRVGLAAARTLGAVLDVVVHGVCGLDVIAYAAVTDGTLAEPFVAAIDARRREVYWAYYDGDGTRTSGPDVGPAADIAAAVGGALLPGAGAGAKAYPDAFARVVPPEHPSAARMAEAVAAKAVPITPPDPLYLRRPDATPPAAPKSVLT